MNKVTTDEIAKLQSDLNVLWRQLDTIQFKLGGIEMEERENPYGDHRVVERLKQVTTSLMNAGIVLEESVSHLGDIINL